MKAERKVLLGRCEMAEEYTDTGTSLARRKEGGRKAGKEGKEAALLGGLSLGTHEMGFWSLRAAILKSELATVGPWRLENVGDGGGGCDIRGSLDQQRILSPKRIEQETPL